MKTLWWTSLLIKGKAVDFYVYYTKNGKQHILSHKEVVRYACPKTLVYNDHVHIEIH